MSARELPSTFKLATLWLLILTLGFLGFKAWEHQRAQSRIEIAGGEIVLQRGPDGHFHWRGQLRGPQHSRMVDFLSTPAPPAPRCPRRWRASWRWRPRASHCRRPLAAPRRAASHAPICSCRAASARSGCA